MKLYLNPFKVVVQGPQGYEFPDLVNELGIYDFKENQHTLFNELISGIGHENTALAAVFGETVVAKWIECKILVTFSIDQKDFYSRSISYYWHKKILEAPMALAKKKVLILGCGGIGSHIAWNMATLGVGSITLVDFDQVEMSNLNRQLLFDTMDIGKLKTAVLKEKLEKINPFIRIETCNERISSEASLKEIILKYKPDCVVKALDSPIYFPVWLDKVCFETQTPYVSGIISNTAQMIGPTYLPNASLGYTHLLKPDLNKERIAGLGPSLGFVMYQLAGELSEEVFKLLTGKGNLKYLNKITVNENIFNDHYTLHAKQKHEVVTAVNYHWVNLVNMALILLIYFVGICLKLPHIWIIGTALLFALVQPIFRAKSKHEVLTYTFVNVVAVAISNIMATYSQGALNSLSRSSILGFIGIIYMFLSIFILLICLMELWAFNVKKNLMTTKGI